MEISHCHQSLETSWTKRRYGLIAARVYTVRETKTEISHIAVNFADVQQKRFQSVQTSDVMTGSRHLKSDGYNPVYFVSHRNEIKWTFLPHCSAQSTWRPSSIGHSHHYHNHHHLHIFSWQKKTKLCLAATTDQVRYGIHTMRYWLHTSQKMPILTVYNRFTFTHLAEALYPKASYSLGTVFVSHPHAMSRSKGSGVSKDGKWCWYFKLILVVKGRKEFLNGIFHPQTTCHFSPEHLASTFDVLSRSSKHLSHLYPK